LKVHDSSKLGIEQTSLYVSECCIKILKEGVIFIVDIIERFGKPGLDEDEG
jgi:hypothetical protein